MTLSAQKTALEVVSEMYEAASQGNIEGMQATVGEDFELHEPTYLPWRGVYHGPAGFREELVAGGKLVDVPSVKLEYLFGDDERVAAVIDVGLINGKRSTVIEEWQVRDGKIRFGRAYWFDPSILDGLLDD
jgi:ketosteroid isomerase-like protein